VWREGRQPGGMRQEVGSHMASSGTDMAMAPAFTGRPPHPVAPTQLHPPSRTHPAAPTQPHPPSRTHPAAPTQQHQQEGAAAAAPRRSTQPPSSAHLVQPVVSHQAEIVGPRLHHPHTAGAPLQIAQHQRRQAVVRVACRAKAKDGAVQQAGGQYTEQLAGSAFLVTQHAEYAITRHCRQPQVC
jgi:hypothetical protein